MLEPLENAEGHQGFIKINLQSRIEQYTSYVTYEIKIETNDPSFSFQESTIHRRYSDFRVLHTMLTKQFPFIKLPSLPPKAPFKRSFDLKYVEKRREALEEFLAKMLSKKLYLSSRAFHLFLQTNFTMSEIKDMVEGKVPAVEAEDVITYTSISPLNDASDQPLSQDHLSKHDNSSTAAKSSITDSPLGSKRVSFCDQVTIAEIHGP